MVITTSSLGIIISDKNSVNTRFLPLKFSLEKAKAEGMVINSISAVVIRVNIRVFRKYLPRETRVKASI